MVEQTSVHEVLKNSGQRYKVPPDVCRIIHVRVCLRGMLTLDQLNVDKRLWDFSEKLILNVDKELKRAGLLSSEGQSWWMGWTHKLNGENLTMNVHPRWRGHLITCWLNLCREYECHCNWLLFICFLKWLSCFASKCSTCPQHQLP